MSEYTAYVKERYEEVLAQQETEHDKEAMRLRAQVMSVEDDAKRMRTKCKSQVHTIHSIHYTHHTGARTGEKHCLYTILTVHYNHHTGARTGEKHCRPAGTGGGS
jgi:hypothetical protein